MTARDEGDFATDVQQMSQCETRPQVMETATVELHICFNMCLSVISVSST